MNSPETTVDLYLDLLKKVLTRLAFPHEYRAIFSPGSSDTRMGRAAQAFLGALLAKVSGNVFRRTAVDASQRYIGKDWPAEAETMIGMRRLDQLQACIASVLENAVPGDLIEAGAWRGGAAIFMRAVLKAHGDATRTVWVADSFQGLPKPDGRFAQDRGDSHWRFQNILAVSLDEVKENFARYGLLDDQVRFLPGWFKDTLPDAPIHRLAVLRADGDMYSSTTDILETLYPKVSPGGYVVIDDYGAVPACKKAVDDYRAKYAIGEPLQEIDWTGRFWQKQTGS